mmetsp:Transcript_54181/g.131480  ORF Transcript_54181/g.131480 Transcript_54181/m.131480 type:complete len:91 (+) Transcript_54181:200-472(+)
MSLCVHEGRVCVTEIVKITGGDPVDSAVVDFSESRSFSTFVLALTRLLPPPLIHSSLESFPSIHQFLASLLEDQSIESFVHVRFDTTRTV